MPTQAPESADSILFEALIVPHRSLSVTGRRRLMLVLAALCGLIAVRFWLLGAWPVIAFCGLEIGLVLFLLYLNGRRALGTELVLLTADSLRVIRTTPSGKRSEVALSSAWLNVTLEESNGRVPRLLLGMRSRRVEVGSALGEAEKRDLAACLRDALHAARNPRFDHPHLDAAVKPPPGPST